MHEAVHVNYAWGRPPTYMRTYTYAAWGRTRTPSFFPHFLLFKQHFGLKAVCIWMHIVRKEFRSSIQYHKQRKLAFIALEWKCYKRTRAISRVRLYPVAIKVSKSHEIWNISYQFIATDQLELCILDRLGHNSKIYVITVICWQKVCSDDTRWRKWGGGYLNWKAKIRSRKHKIRHYVI